MEHIKSKETLRNFVGDLVDNEQFNILFCDEVHYKTFVFSNSTTYLQRCILLVDDYEGMCDYIEYYLSFDNNEVNKISNNGWTAIFFLIYCKKKINKIFNILIHAGANINVMSKNEYTPLMIALLNENMDFAKLLILEGADVFNIVSWEGYTAYFYLPKLIKYELGINLETRTISALQHKNVKASKK